MTNNTNTQGTPGWLLAIAWLWAGLPLAWGVMQTLQKTAALFM